MIVSFNSQIPNSRLKWEHLDSAVIANKNPNQEMVGPPQGLLGESVNILCMHAQVLAPVGWGLEMSLFICSAVSASYSLEFIANTEAAVKKITSR